MIKETKDKKIEIRVSAKEYHKLKLRADLYSEGNLSRLIRHWISKAPVEYLLRRKPLNELSQEEKI